MCPTAPSTPSVFQREEELALGAAALAAARSGAGRAVLVSGPGGIGKTTVLAELRARAVDGGLRVLCGAGTERRDTLAHDVVRGLFAETAPPSPGSEAVLQRLAGREALPTGEAEQALFDGLLMLLDELAADRPLLVVVDDAQWADAASLRWLARLAGAVDAMPVSLLTAWRTGATMRTPDLPSELVGSGAAQIVLAPLGPRATASLITARMGRAAEPGFADACRDLTSGNPFALVELCRRLQGVGESPTAAAIPLATRLAPLPPGTRLEALGKIAERLVAALAVAGAPAPPGLLAELADLSPGQLADAREELRTAGLLDAVPGDRFAHPLLASAAYERLEPARRDRLHRRAAELLVGRGAIETAAVHLVHVPATGDPDVARVLLDAATAILALGDATGAIGLLDRALAEDAAPVTPHALLARARAARLVGADDARERAEAAVAAADRPLRAAAVLELALACGLDGEPERAVNLLEAEAAGQVAGTPAHEQAKAMLAAYALTHDTTAGRVAPLLHAVRVGPPTDYASAALQACASAHHTLRGDTTGGRAAALAAAALTGDHLHGGAARDTLLYGWAARALVWADRGIEAVPAVDRALADATGRGWRLGAAVALAWRALEAWWAGRLTEGHLHVTGAVDVGAGHLPAFGQEFVLAAAVLVTTDLGALAEAETLLAQHLSGHEPAATTSGSLLRWARVRLALAGGEPGAALGDVEALVHHERRRGGVALGVRPDLARVLRLVGREDQAVALLSTERRVAQAWGVASHVAVAEAAASELHDGPLAISELTRAVAGLRGTPRDLELARALLLLGARLRIARERAAARAPLREALHLATRAGAAAVGEAARVELRATGARPRSAVLSGREALTPSELRVAQLAAGGHSNPEIARALFVTRATVERHLTAAYRKLEVSGRPGLAEALA